MSARTGILVLLLVLGALVAGFLLLGWEDAFFGDSDGRGAGSGGASETPADVGDATSRADPSPRAARGATLFGRARASAKGVGSVVARVVRAGDPVLPVAGAVVAVAGVGYGDEAVAASAPSDERGLVSLTGVAAGSGYVLRVSAPGEAPVEWRDVAVDANTANDLGDLVVGARGALEGKVVDEEGRGIAAASVRVHPGSTSLAEFLGNLVEMVTTLDREPLSIARATTGSDGGFRIEGLPPGAVTVVAVAPGRVTGRTTAVLGPRGHVGGPLTIALAKGVRVAGRVEREDGSPVAAARVAVMGMDDDDPTGFLYDRVFTETAADGSFAATVSPDVQKLSALVAAEGHATTTSDSFAPGATDVRVVLRDGIAVEVAVVTHGTREPVEGAGITIAVGGQADEPGALAAGVTGADGRATVLCPPGAVTMVLVSHPTRLGGIASPHLGEMAILGGTTLEADVPKAIERGARNAIEIRLRDGARVVGRVLDPAGNPLAGVEVRIEAFFGGSKRTVRSGADGSYRVDGVSTGRMTRISVRAPGWILRSNDASLEGDPAGGAEIAKDLVLRPASRVVGRVVGPDETPVAGARVRLRGGAGVEYFVPALGGGDAGTVATDADGRYEIGEVEGSPPDRLAPTATVSVRAEGFVPAVTPGFRVAEGGVAEAPLVRLSRGVSVRGTVVDPGGRPVPGARVEVSVQTTGTPSPEQVLEMAESQREEKAVADAQGRFEVAGLPPGRLSVTASGGDLAPGRAVVDATSGDAVRSVEVRLRPARTLRVRVLSPEGTPVTGAMTSGVSDAEDPESFLPPTYGVSGSDGWVSFERLPRVRLRVKATAQGFLDADAVVEADATTAELRLGRLSPADQARVAEIDAEMGRLMESILSGAPDSSVTERWGALRREKQEIEARAKGAR